jgi:SAM-dependent methyltransferase
MSPSGETAIWHDVECGAYNADLPLWEELAAASTGPVLDLGCGTGRVALHLGRHGKEITGLDREPELAAELNDRADSLPVRAEVGDARSFELGRSFGLILAPMQLVQLFEGGASDRLAFLTCVKGHLKRGGIAAVAIVEEVLGGVSDELDSVPDAREVEGRLYSSQPIETVVDREWIVLRRLRKSVSPEGVLNREESRVDLRVLSAETLEREASRAGLHPAGRRAIEATEDHIGSTVVLMRGEA